MAGVASAVARSPNSSNSRRTKTRLWSPPGVAGKSPSSPQRALVEVDEGVEVGDRVGRLDELDLARGLGAPDLAPDLVALLLAERREEGVEVARPRGAG